MLPVRKTVSPCTQPCPLYFVLCPVSQPPAAPMTATDTLLGPEVENWRARGWENLGGRWSELGPVLLGPVLLGPSPGEHDGGVWVIRVWSLDCWLRRPSERWLKVGTESADYKTPCTLTVHNGTVHFLTHSQLLGSFAKNNLNRLFIEAGFGSFTCLKRVVRCSPGARCCRVAFPPGSSRRS